jgi:WXXGXW repeat (2 copies)
VEIRQFRLLKEWNVKKTLLAALLAFSLLPGAANAQIYVRIEPPAPIVERRPSPPEHGFVWIDGYHRWDGHRYVWVAGRWDRPPHPHAVWVAHHWEHRHDGWVLIEGHWR